MKLYVVLAVVSLATLSACFPGAKQVSRDEVELVPSGKRYNPFDVVDVNANPSDFDDDFDEDFPGITQGWKDSFSAFMKRVTDLVKNVRTQVAKDLEDKLKNGTTTSTVEIINGHKVVKNQTVYEDPHTYVKSVVFEVIPNSDETPNGSNPEVDVEVTTAKSKPKDREPLEDSVENEVNALNEGESINIETLGDQNVPPKNFAYKTTDNDNNWYEMNQIKPERDIELIDSNEIPTREDIDDLKPIDLKPIDLSSDIRVNDILTEQNYPRNPNAETFEAIEPVEIIEKIPNEIDLSSDIKVNDILNDRGYPKNPNAELFEPIEPVKIIEKSPNLIDLSSDIKVNDILSDRGYPKNPNAEIFEVDVPKLVVT